MADVAVVGVEVAPKKSIGEVLTQSHTLVSTKHVDVDNLSAFEAVSMTAVFVLAVLVGVIQSTPIV